MSNRSICAECIGRAKDYFYVCIPNIYYGLERVQLFNPECLLIDAFADIYFKGWSLIKFHTNGIFYD